MKSLKRGSNLITLMISLFIVGLCILLTKMILEAPFYVSHSSEADLGFVYDRNGEILFDGNAKPGDYPDGHFKDVGNLIGDTSGQMTNTLVSKNMEKLSNYSFLGGITKDGQAAIYTTLDHAANEQVYTSFGGKDGCAIAYNYSTGEILVCVSRPNVDPISGYDDVENLPDGSLLCKAFSKTVPGSTQKVATLLAADQAMGYDTLMSKSYDCQGVYRNNTGIDIICHQSYGHGTQSVPEAFANSCNPFFAQLVEDPDWSIGDIEEYYEKMWIAVNDNEEKEFTIDGIISDTASTKIDDKNEFDTQWGCIGQGYTMVSPCMMMMWESAIANGTGMATMPYLIDHVTNVSGRTVQTASAKTSEQLFSESSAQDIRDIMLENGNNYSLGYTVGIKSGTAQVKEGREENALLTGFVDDEDFPIAFAVLVENGTSYESSYVAQTLLSAIDK